MTPVLWTPSALRDLQNISVYIESRSTLTTANRVCRTIYDTVQRLRRFPETGKIGLEAGTHEFVVPEFPAYIIAYRIAPHKRIEVLRIWHGAQER